LGKSLFGVARVLVPVVYCGWLLHYFLDLSGSMEEAANIGLGPTVIGLGAIGLLLSVPLLLRVIRMFARLPAPGGGSDEPFDPDAAIARYKAQKSEEPTRPAPASPRPAPKSAPRPTFGRR
jgi:hypothetical protein